MSDTVIRVNNLSKLYQIGTARDKADGLRHAVEDGFRRFGQRLRGRPITKPVTEDFWALKDVSFEVKRGECVGVIGRNGAGKSTLLKILSRITEPTSGEIGLKGRVGSLLEVGTGFHPELTGRENIFLNGAVLGMPRSVIMRKFDEIVAFSEVEKFLDTPVKRYSSGMYVRLAFAVAAHLEPEVLIIDEVLGVGDAAFQNKCLKKMDDVTKDGRTVLVVSHNAEMIAALCRFGLLMVAGRLEKTGTMIAVLTSYLNKATSSKDGTYCLHSHPLRSPDLTPIIQEIELIGPNGLKSSAFRSLERFTIRLHLRSPLIVRDARIAVAVEDNLSRRLFTVANYLADTTTIDLIGPVIAECVVPELRLGAGRYLVSVSISTRSDGLLDSVDGAGWFDVEAHNPYGTGESFSPVYGPILETSTWVLL